MRMYRNRDAWVNLARRTLRVWVPAAAAVCLAACGAITAPADSAAGGSNPAVNSAAGQAESSDRSIAVDGLQRRYRLHVPPAAADGKPLPLVLNFHGYSGTGEMHENFTMMSKLADEEGFLVAYPEGTGDPQGWLQPNVDELGFVRQMIDAIDSQYPVDPARIHAAGFSNGAEMTRRLVCDLSDRLASAAMVSGDYPADEPCEPGRRLPVILFHGTEDSVLPYDGIRPSWLPVRDWAARQADRNGCGSEPRILADGKGVAAEEWTECAGDSAVALYTYRGLGHLWPGAAGSDVADELAATPVMWDFFRAHPLRAEE